MFSLDAFHKEYETDINDLVINGRKFKILLPKDLHRFMNAADVMHEFPLWAKIWPASWILAGYLAEMPVAPGKRFLEIGGGIGLVSMASGQIIGPLIILIAVAMYGTSTLLRHTVIARPR